LEGLVNYLNDRSGFGRIVGNYGKTVNKNIANPTILVQPHERAFYPTPKQIFFLKSNSFPADPPFFEQQH